MSVIGTQHEHPATGTMLLINAFTLAAVKKGEELVSQRMRKTGTKRKTNDQRMGVGAPFLSGVPPAAAAVFNSKKMTWQQDVRSRLISARMN